jgi:hypothetical protein
MAPQMLCDQQDLKSSVHQKLLRNCRDSKDFAEGVMRDAGVHIASGETDLMQGEFSLCCNL